eukprot:jgi/Orpsp1_1/1184160/evm.model.c7180000088254.1
MKKINFFNNIVEKFGGAIYSEYDGLHLSKVSKITFSENKASIAGGALFTKYNITKNIFSYNDLEFENNKGKSYGNDISSYPKRIISNNENKNDTISMSSGNNLSFTFNFYDELKNIVEDSINFFSDFSIKAFLTDNNNSNNITYSIKDDVCNFYYGKCILNNLKIQAVPGNYILKFLLDSNYETTVITEKYNLIITNCTNSEIGIYSRNGLLSCEIPICNANCPVNTKASCIAPKNKNQNRQKYNQCVCYSGYTGEYCNSKIYADFRKITIIGILLILFVSSIYISHGIGLGVLNSNNETLNVTSTIFSKDINIMSKIKSNMIKDEITSSINNTNVQYSYNEHTQNINNNSNIIIKKDISDTNMSEKSISTVTFNKLLTKLCSYNVECIGLYLLIIIVFIGVLFFDHKNIEDDEEANEIQDDANEWYFKCNIENIELF